MTDLWSFWCCLKYENTNKQNNNFERDWFCKYCLSILYVTQDKDLTYLKRLCVTHHSDALHTPAIFSTSHGLFHFSSATSKPTTWWRTRTQLQSFSWVVTVVGVGEKNDGLAEPYEVSQKMSCALTAWHISAWPHLFLVFQTVDSTWDFFWLYLGWEFKKA